jgi:hypothetical protein
MRLKGQGSNTTLLILVLAALVVLAALAYFNFLAPR